MRFQYQVDQDTIELKASNWFGLEELFLNGQCIRKTYNFSPFSNHKVKLSSGHNCNFQMFVDPTNNQVVCRIYKKDQLLARLTHHKEKHKAAGNIINAALITIGLISLALFSFYS